MIIDLYIQLQSHHKSNILQMEKSMLNTNYAIFSCSNEFVWVCSMNRDYGDDSNLLYATIKGANIANVHI